MTTNGQSINIADNPTERRYEMTLDGEPIGFVDYRLTPGHIVLSYIEVDPTYSGRGLGARLTASVLEDCRSRGLTVSPRCPYIADFIRAHPEYEDLVADGRRG